ncbi:hypothetical protein OAD20_01520 [Cyclobacteriaceae bacterium]|jgi:hypothetical protein|nr:hypothetical protein [Cyclobacteriaceae bacterium]MDB9939337.1 hypothetical protein [Cyclobacteriaceae bacterium]
MIKPSYLYIVVVLLISSCNVDQLDVEGLKLSENTGLYAFPIGETTYQLMELLEDADSTLAIDTDENGMISFSFLEVDTIGLAEESDEQDIDLNLFVRQSVDFPISSFNIPLFETFESGSFLLENPELNFTIKNELRMPLAIGLVIWGEKLDSLGELDSIPLNIYDAFFDLSDTLKSISNLGLTDTAAVSSTFITLNKTNSDFDQFLGKTPETIYMKLSMVANADLDTGVIKVFLPPDTIPDREFNAGAQIFTSMELELPMSIHLADLAVPVDLDSISVDVDVATLDSLQLRVVTYNMLPFGALLNLQFLDASGVVLYSLEEGFQVLANPPLNSINFNVKEPEININQVWLTGEGIDALNDTQTIKIIMTLNTTDGAPNIYTPLLEDYTLEVKISGKVRLSYEL